MPANKDARGARDDDPEVYAERLATIHPLREPAIRAAIAALDLPKGSRGLDAGCGIGHNAVLLARAVGSKGSVTGLDVSSEFITRGERLAAESGLADRMVFRKGDIRHLPFEDDAFDWAWCADTLWVGSPGSGHSIEDPGTPLSELVRVVRPGGLVALVFWSSQKLLPGHPLLEARLNATSTANEPFRPGMDPSLHFLRAPGWMRGAGLHDPSARTFVAEARAPLSPEIRSALAVTIPMFWESAEPEVSKEDWAEYRRLCEPGSPDFILDLPDYYAFLTYTMFTGSRAE
jgi:ubiquinone/menaquinone biosynthesis C-methylase UbiE